MLIGDSGEVRMSAFAPNTFCARTTSQNTVTLSGDGDIIEMLHVQDGFTCFFPLGVHKIGKLDFGRVYSSDTVMLPFYCHCEKLFVQRKIESFFTGRKEIIFGTKTAIFYMSVFEKPDGQCTR